MIMDKVSKNKRSDIMRAVKSKNSKRRFYCINIMGNDGIASIFLLNAEELKKMLNWLGFKSYTGRGKYLIREQK